MINVPNSDESKIKILSSAIDLTLPAPYDKPWAFADKIGLDQTAQNVSSDLNLYRPLVSFVEGGQVYTERH